MTNSFCSSCGNRLNLNKQARFCPHCGNAFDNATSYSSPNDTEYGTTNVHVHVGRGPYNKWIALLFLILLGIFGAHKFYEGKFFMGIVYFFTVGLFGFGIVFDFLVLIFKPTEYYL